MNIDELQDLKDWFQYKEVTRKSKAKQSEVDTFVSMIKKVRWKREKPGLLNENCS